MARGAALERRSHHHGVGTLLHHTGEALVHRPLGEQVVLEQLYAYAERLRLLLRCRYALGYKVPVFAGSVFGNHAHHDIPLLRGKQRRMHVGFVAYLPRYPHHLLTTCLRHFAPVVQHAVHRALRHTGKCGNVFYRYAFLFIHYRSVLMLFFVKPYKYST